MRQAGIVAEAARFALREHRGRLVRDHENARAIANILAGVPGVRVDPALVETNIVLVETPQVQSDCVVQAAKERGVLVSGFGACCVRLVTHMDVEETAIRGGQILAEVIDKLHADRGRGSR